MAASSGDRSASGGGVGCASGDESACSTPFVSAPSSPDRDPSPARDPSFSAAGCFYSAPVSPARGGPGTADEYGGCELGFDFDFASRCPSPAAAAAAMFSADELFHNGQIRPVRLASFLLRPQALPPLDGDIPRPPQPPPSEQPAPAGTADERGRLLRSPPVHRRYRSLSPFRARWLSPSSSPAPAAKSLEPAAAGEAASRSSSSSSTASSASSSSSSRSYYRRWGFLKGILHRRKSDGGGHPPLPSNASPPPAPKRNPSPSSPAAASRGRGRARRSSAHARLYEARRAEAEEMRRRTFLPYRQSLLLLGFLGLGSRGYGAMHGRATAAAGKARP